MSRSALPEAISTPKTGSLDTCQHWPFRAVRSCRGVRGPNTDRVTPVNYTTYAVVDLAGICLDNRQNRLRQQAILPFSG
jgi:hypothetical protein